MITMKKLKTIMALILTLTLFAIGTAVSINAAENTTPTFFTDSVSGNVGDEVELAFKCKNNPGINGWRLSISYDSDALQLVKCDNTGVFGEVTFSQSINENPYNAQWYSLGDSTVNGKMFALAFKINENAKSGDYPINITYSQDEVVNVKEEEVHFDIINGVVAVNGLEPQTTEPITTEPITQPDVDEPTTDPTSQTETQATTAISATTEPSVNTATSDSATKDSINDIDSSDNSAIQTGSIISAVVVLAAIVSLIVTVYIYRRKKA